MKRLFIILFCSLTIISSAQTAKDFFNRASKKYKDKEYAAAAVEYTRALELAPESAVLFNNRGLCYYKLEKWDKAKDDYDRAVTLDPNYKEAYLNLGNVYIDKSDYDKAVLSFDKALVIDSMYTIVFAKKAFVLYQLEDYKGALKFYDKAIENSAVEKATLYNARGATHAKLGNDELAIADYDKTLSLTPDAYETFINRGILKTKLKNFDAAIKDFTVAQSFAGMSGEGYYYRGLCRVGQLDAIRTSKDKHYVMDIKKNNKLLELACSDFDKSKKLSYGRAFEAHQEYCIEKTDGISQGVGSSNKASKKEVIAKQKLTDGGTIKYQNAPADAAVVNRNAPKETLSTDKDNGSYESESSSTPTKEVVTSKLTTAERARLKAEIKSEIIAELLKEYELVPRAK